MPEDLANQIGEVFQAMGSAIIQTVFFYFALPIIAIAIIGRFVLKIQGKLLGIVIFLVAVGSLFIFLENGLPKMQEIYFSILDND